MKITRSLIVELDGAKFHFDKPDLRTFLEMQKQDNNLARLETILKSCFKVEGLTDDSGKEILVNELNELKLPMDAVTKIVTAYNDVAFSFLQGKKVDEEKKDSVTA